MTNYRVHLDIFAGPLDLLLYLVRKEEVDIYDIPIRKITDQYVEYVEMLKQLDIDLAGDFLVMAATLMEIKSAMLLPRAEPDEVAQEGAGDPRSELIRQLLEYKRFKDAANLLGAAAEQQKDRFSRPKTIIERLSDETEPEIDIEQISVWDLLEAFDTICKATGARVDSRHIKDDTPIDLYQIEILHRLQCEGALTFERLFEGKPNRLVMVGMFLALLELIRDRLAWAEQPAQGAQIYVRSLTDEPPEQAVQRAIMDVDEAFEAQATQGSPAGEAPVRIVEVPATQRPAEAHAEAVRHESDHDDDQPSVP